MCLADAELAMRKSVTRHNERDVVSGMAAIVVGDGATGTKNSIAYLKQAFFCSSYRSICERRLS